jgi:cytoskeletal protein CcmA (bactofilin family)
MLYGRLEGAVFTDGEVWVGPDAVVEGGIHARRIEVEGTCRGRLEALECITLRSGALLHGEAACDVVQVDPGARFTGWRSAPGAGGPRVETYRAPRPGTA